MLKGFLDNCLVISRDEDSFFLCNSLHVAGDDVVSHKTLLFSEKAILDLNQGLEKIDGKESLYSLRSVFNFRNLITTPEIFLRKSKPWGFTGYSHRVLLTFRIDDETHEVVANSISIGEDFCYIDNPSNYSFWKEYPNIGYSDDTTYRRPSYKWDSKIDQSPRLFAKSYCNYVKVDGIVEYQSPSRQLIIPRYLLFPFLITIDSISTTPVTNETSMRVEKTRNILTNEYTSDDIELIKTYKSVTIICKSYERFKERDRASSYSYDWFETTKTQIYTREFESDNRAIRCYEAIKKNLNDTSVDSFELKGFELSEHERTDWD